LLATMLLVALPGRLVKSMLSWSVVAECLVKSMLLVAPPGRLVKSCSPAVLMAKFVDPLVEGGQTRDQ
jgi:hypothetical protein